MTMLARPCRTTPRAHRLALALALACAALPAPAARAGEAEGETAVKFWCPNGRKFVFEVPTLGQLARGEKTRLTSIKIVFNGEIAVGRTSVTQGIDSQLAAGLMLLSCEALDALIGLSKPGEAVPRQATGLPGIEAFRVGREPVGTAEGDFNRDGQPDLAVANFGSHDVSILLAGPDGTLANPFSAPTGQNPVRILAGDFNGDQKPDLVTQHNAELSLLLGNGDGTFQPPVSRAAVTGPGEVIQGVVAADFNGDGHPDLIVSASQTSLHLANGDGTFQAPVVLAGVPAGDVAHAVADLDGDPHPDLVTSTAVLRGAGGGTFHPVQVRPPGFFPFRLLLEDLNGDGRLDLVGLSVPERAVSVSLGNGNGSFQPPRHYSVTPSLAVTVVDMDGDGFLDIVTSDVPSEHISVLPGNGDGTFRGAPVLLTSTAAFSPGSASVAAGDFNGDGVPDLAVGHRSGPATVLLRQAGGASAPLDLGASGFVAVGELTGNDQVDVAVAGPGGGGSELTVRPGTGSGGFGAPIVTSLPAGDIFGFQAADLNGDTRLDAVVLYPEQLVVLMGNGDGTFQAPRVTPGGTRLQGLALADFDGDGRLDVALADAGDFNALNGRVRILRGQGDGTFQAAPALLPGTALVGVAAGDFTGDGAADVAAVFESPVFTWRIALLRGNGDGTFQAPLEVPAPGGLDFFPTSPMAATHFDGDSHLDLVVFTSGHRLVILSGNGDGTFRPPVFLDASGTVGLLVTDLDGDGRPDLAVPNGESGVTLIANRTIPDPTLSLQVNQTAFAPGRTVTVEATLTPGVAPGAVDAYFVVQAPPAGALFSILPGNVLVPGVVPFAAGFTPVPLTGQVVSYRFTGGEPPGLYRILTGLAAAGSAPPAVIGPVREAPFLVVP